MDELAVDALVDLPGGAVDEAFHRHDVHRHIGEHELDGLEVADRPAELHALARPFIRDLRSADRGAETIGGNLQPGLDEPVLRQLKPRTDPAENAPGLELHGIEHEFRVPKDIGVHELRHALDTDARQVLVDEEERGLVRIAVDMGMDHEIVGVIAGGDEPLLAAEDVFAVDIVRAGSDEARIRACPGLGDGVGGPTLAAATRYEIGLLLSQRAVLQRNGRVPQDGPERSRRLADLLVYEGLLKLAQALAAVLLVVVDGIKALLDDG